MDIKTYLASRRQLVDDTLTQLLPQPGNQLDHHVESMNYSLQAGGKRVRPILCMAAAEALLGRELGPRLLPVACALECIHTYSLIHDDLPAMDNDALRRGKPTNHAVYGEAAAILAGDGLHCFAFDLLSSQDCDDIPPEARLSIIGVIARAAGPLGMVGGQYLDVINEGREISYELLRTIHRSKTGALITAAVLAGGIAAGASTEQKRLLTSYGNAVGLAFQIVDDILNVEATPEQLGKAVGSDAARGKATYPALFGLDKSKTMAADAVAAATHALEAFGDDAEPLRALARYITHRTA